MFLTRLRFYSEILSEHWLWTQTVCLLRMSIEIEDLPFVATNGLLAKILHRQFHTK